MALISGVLTNYVEDGYINDQDDFMVNGILDVGFTISAELTQSGWTHEAVFTPTANFSIQASLEIAHLTHEGELDATANFSIQASLEITQLTHEGELDATANFSISTTPTIILYKFGELDIEIVASTDTTASKQMVAEVDVSSSFTQSTTASNLITIDAEGRYGWDNPSDWDNWGIWRNTWTLPTDFNTTILGGYVVEGELDISSSMVYECAIDGRLSGDILCEIISDMYTEGNLNVTGGVSINTSFGATVTASNNTNALCAISSSFTSDTYGINIKAAGLEVDASFTTSALAKNNINTGLDISASVSSTIACGMVYRVTSDITSSFTQTTSGVFKTTDYNRYITVAPETRIITISEAPETRIISISEATRVLVIPSKIQTRNAA